MFFKKTKKKMVSIEGILNEENIFKIKDSLENLVDVSKAKVDIKKKCIIISYDVTIDEFLIKDTLEKLGYSVTGIKELS